MDTLSRALTLLPTPTRSDANGPDAVRFVSPETALAGGRASSVEWGKYEPAIRRWESVLGRLSPNPTIPGKNGRPRLNPAFCEWLTGLDGGHVTGHGLTIPQQLKLLGNGVVPQQALLALSLLDPALERAA